MKKIIKLTESDLTRIVQRVINESDKNIIRENIVYGGVKMYPANPKGGPIILSYKGVELKYSINAVVKKFGVKLYSGPIAVVSIWKKEQVGYFVQDNTDKIFQIPLDQLGIMADAAKDNQKQIKIAGTGEVAGISGTYYAKLTQTA